MWRAEGKLQEAERLYTRSLAIREKALGPGHQDVAESLENYASLLRKLQRNDEAAAMESRARQIRAGGTPSKSNVVR